jgi:hypothetical protein
LTELLAIRSNPLFAASPHVRRSPPEMMESLVSACADPDAGVALDLHPAVLSLIADEGNCDCD